MILMQKFNIMNVGNGKFLFIVGLKSYLTEAQKINKHLFFTLKTAEY